MLSDAAHALLVSRGRALPPSDDHAEDDYVANLLRTVLDVQTREAAVSAAVAHYRLHRWDVIRTHGDPVAVLARYPDDNEGNRHWIRWLLIRQRVETVKPDLHVHRFAASVLGRDLGDREVVEVLTAVARDLGLEAYELDWRIWDHQRTQPRGGR